MKIYEFIEKAKVTNNEQMIKKMINTKEYLPFAEKKVLAKRIVEKSKVQENGFTRIDEINKYLIFTVECIQAYTDLEFDESLDVASSEYDMLVQNKKLNTVIGTFESEYKTVLELCAMEVDFIMQSNSIEYQTAMLFNGIINILGSLSGVLEDKVNSFNIDDLISPEQLMQLNGFLNQYMK